jgi:outer membrane lipoprotein carrier protein
MALLVAAAMPTSVEAEGSPAVVTARKVQAYYEGVKDLRAGFVQTYFRRMTSRTNEERGTIAVKKPGKFRWSYRKPYVREVYVNGNTAWYYEPEEQQAIRRTIDPATYARELSFLTGSGKLSDAFIISVADPAEHRLAEGLVGLELRPKAPGPDSRYEKLVLGVEPGSGEVRTTILHLTNRDVNRYDFRDIETNRGLDDARFRFTPPPGVDVVD